MDLVVVTGDVSERSGHAEHGGKDMETPGQKGTGRDIARQKDPERPQKATAE